ncbi:Exodeoxyribonuclease 7 small subunit [Polystyrenella longa]|uniref:Exodeoxyribonuclease 7 small subunit n=1 Tax=Polystyrenella longa TaxID=2528007 RepID=A0A518CUK2_9PLAN|nr:exodeoxyribonuclease VII small subunit [Polystyrenella longa]QDU82864.1 Exodeoxyribonuclease 7 small subunit [Polystyrenella longa]
MAKKAKDNQEESAPSFEEALTRLQDIVTDLESGEMGLETSLQRYEEGVGLIRLCYQTLEAAEQKIEILTRLDSDGDIETEPFDAESTFSQTGGEAKRRKSSVSRSKAKPKPKPDESEDDPEEDPRKLLF